MRKQKAFQNCMQWVAIWKNLEHSLSSHWRNYKSTMPEASPTKELMSQSAKPTRRTVLFISLLGKGLTPRACMRDIGSNWWAPVPAKCFHFQVFGNQILFLVFCHIIYRKLKQNGCIWDYSLDLNSCKCLQTCKASSKPHCLITAGHFGLDSWARFNTFVNQ